MSISNVVQIKLRYLTFIVCHFIQNMSMRPMTIQADQNKTVLFLLLRVGVLSDELVIIETEKCLCSNMNQGPKKSTGHTGRDSQFVDNTSGPHIPVKLSGNAVSTRRNAITPALLSCQKFT
jgi:hypothetical protein